MNCHPLADDVMRIFWLSHDHFPLQNKIVCEEEAKDFETKIDGLTHKKKQGLNMNVILNRKIKNLNDLSECQEPQDL